MSRSGTFKLGELDKLRSDLDPFSAAILQEGDAGKIQNRLQELTDESDAIGRDGDEAMWTRIEIERLMKNR